MSPIWLGMFSHRVCFNHLNKNKLCTARMYNINLKKTFNQHSKGQQIRSVKIIMINGIELQTQNPSQTVECA